MGAYYQSATRNLTMLALCTLAAAFFSWLYFDDHGSFMMLIYTVAAAAGALHSGWGFIQKEPAIAFDRSGLQLRRWCGTAEIPWKEVHGVSTKVVTIRSQKVKWLSVACEGGLFGSRNISVSLGSLDIPTGSEELVAAAVHQAWVAAVGEAATAMAAAGHTGWGANFYDRPDAATGFDADAAFARYQAKAMQGDAQPSAPIEAAPSASPAFVSPPRPVFGRKAAE